MKESWKWEKEDLDNLIGKAEDLRLDFKCSKLFEGSRNAVRNKVSEDLSRLTSAFANTEGGIIVIGIEERKEGKAKIADRIDSGVDHTEYSPEWLQQVVESNISPSLTGVRVKSIFLNPERTRCAYVIHVPQGSTAYQAKDKLYYGRSEYECKALSDHEIRLKMFRGRLPDAIISIIDCERKKSDFINVQHQDRSGHVLPVVYPKDYDKHEYIYSYSIVLKNTGELNIDEFKVNLTYEHRNLENFCYLSSEVTTFPKWSEAFRDGYINRHQLLTQNAVPYGSLEAQVNSKNQINIYSQDIYILNKERFGYLYENFDDNVELLLNWTLYFKNSLPKVGQINVSREFKDI